MAEIIKTDEEEDKVEVDRWQNYGKDRLYFNAANSGTGPIPGTANCYLDLQAGEAVMEIDDTYGGKDRHQLVAELIDEGVVRVENGNGTVVLVIDLIGGRDIGENGEENESSDKELITDGGTDVEKADEDDVKLLSTPSIRVETDSGAQVYDDALDAEIAVRDGDLPPGGIVWREISPLDVDKLLQKEVPGFRDRLDQTLEQGEYEYVEEASRDTIKEIDRSGIDSTGTYMFVCEKCGHEECRSAAELRLRCDLHRINDVYYHDDDGNIQKDDGHSMTLWKLIGSGDIARLSEAVRNEQTTETPFVWAFHEMEIERYGAEDADTSRIHDLIRDGLSPSEAVDYHMTVENDFTQEGWAAERGISQQAISKNVRKAKEKLI